MANSTLVAPGSNMGQDANKPRRVNVPVKIERELHRKLKVVASEEGKELSQLVDELLRRPVETRYAKIRGSRPGGEQS